ncbi:hypothetical protein AB0M44_14075 [Streptosporangium subroseum]|uniref:hypothetical protein n=1 Tax=Streptosporangium subroseum TaxID=106412 RepID=UPI003421E24A
MNRCWGAAGLLLLCLGLAGCSVGGGPKPTFGATAKTTTTTEAAMTPAKAVPIMAARKNSAQGY